MGTARRLETIYLITITPAIDRRQGCPVSWDALAFLMHGGPERERLVDKDLLIPPADP